MEHKNIFVPNHSPALSRGIKLTFFPSSHLATKYVEVVTNSKTLVAIVTHTDKKALSTLRLISTANTIKIRTIYKGDTRIGHIQC